MYVLQAQIPGPRPHPSHGAHIKTLLELETSTVPALGGLTLQAAEQTADVLQHEEDTAPRTGLGSQSGCQEVCLQQGTFAPAQRGHL